MSINSVEAAIQQVQKRIVDFVPWGPMGLPKEFTRSTFIDPVITALGWDTSDPRECHPEYRRVGGDEAAGRADYALFGTPDLDAIGNGTMAPDVIIEVKGLPVALEEHVEQLRHHVEAVPEMRKGVAVLTNGGVWWLYDLDRRGAFQGKRIDPIYVVPVNPREAALILNEWLDRRRFG